jgi:hypothetical protein
MAAEFRLCCLSICPNWCFLSSFRITEKWNSIFFMADLLKSSEMLSGVDWPRQAQCMKKGISGSEWTSNYSPAAVHTSWHLTELELSYIKLHFVINYPQVCACQLYLKSLRVKCTITCWGLFGIYFSWDSFFLHFYEYNHLEHPDFFQKPEINTKSPGVKT